MKTDDRRILTLDEAPFFLLRTPYYPVTYWLEWSRELESAALAANGASEVELRAAWDRDVFILRQRMRAFLDSSEFHQAIFLASPSLIEAIRYWIQDPDSRKGLRTERSLVCYFQRMCERPTPFGLFAGCSLGRVVKSDYVADLRLPPRSEYRTSTRLDFQYLFSLVSHLRRLSDILTETSYRANNSLARFGDAWHYVQGRFESNRHAYALVKAQNDPYLEAVIRETHSCSLPWYALVSNVCNLMPSDDISPEEAGEYIRSLIESDILIPDILPPVVSESSLDHLIEKLNALPSARHVHEILCEIREHLKKIDSEPIGVPPDTYRALSRRLLDAGAPVEISRFIQVDMVKPSRQLEIGQGIIRTVKDAIKLLCRIAKRGESLDMQKFKESFTERYERAWVPLAEALDPEIGLGFGTVEPGDGSPMVKGLPLNGHSAPNSESRLTELQTYILKKILRSRDSVEIDLQDDDLPSPEDPLSVLPSSFSVCAVLGASSPDELARGICDIFLLNGSGPSGARMSGRFCEAIPELADELKRFLEQEEGTEPDAVFAEIVHLPEGRLGNVLCRPALRKHEIVFLGNSGGTDTVQIGIDDLLVTVRNGKILLLSKSLKRRVIPRLSNAHGYTNPKLIATYRFLCHLQAQGGWHVPVLNLGPLTSLDYLPRIRIGQVILTLAQWRLSSEEVKSLKSADRFTAFTRLQALRESNRFPRLLEWAQVDNVLPIDLDNPLSVDAFVHSLTDQTSVVLQERFPTCDRLGVEGPEGRFEHELLLSFTVKSRGEERSLTESSFESDDIEQKDFAYPLVPSEARLLTPGSEWQYVKLYCGITMQDRLISHLVPELLSGFKELGESSDCFFLRFADPHPHLRLRLRASLPTVNSILRRVIEPHMSAGEIWKVQYDTYQREVERYGGLAELRIIESLFVVDSDAVSQLLSALETSGDTDSRWQVALISIGRFLADFELDLSQRIAFCGKQLSSFRAEFVQSAALKEQIGDRYRHHRAMIEMMLHSPERLSWYPDITECLENRSRRMRMHLKELAILGEAGQLNLPLESVAANLIHLHVNRMFQSAQRQHEYVCYEYLQRAYKSSLERSERVAFSSLQAPVILDVSQTA